MTLLPFGDRVHISAQKNVKHRTLVAQFGDGYSQRMPDGINHRVESWPVMWPALDANDYATLTAALDSVGGHGVLSWTPPGESTPKKFVVQDGYRVDHVGGGLRAVSLVLQQVFEP